MDFRLMSSFFLILGPQNKSLIIHIVNNINYGYLILTTL